LKKNLSVSVAAIARIDAFAKSGFVTMRRANGVKLLPDRWKEYIRDRLSQPSNAS